MTTPLLIAQYFVIGIRDGVTALTRPEMIGPPLPDTQRWGIFEGAQGMAHVAPCDAADGSLIWPHTLSLDCPCEPFIDDNEPGLLRHRSVTWQ